MPWRSTTPMEQRKQFIEMWQTGAFSMAELCERFTVSRKTGYKWLERYRQAGEPGLADRRRAPHSHPNQVSDRVRDLLVQERDRHPHWGVKKLVPRLSRAYPELEWPVLSTAHQVLVREGRVEPGGKRRSRAVGCRQELLEADRPNTVWTADYKGDFLLGDGHRCYPLTVQDAHSRFLLACEALYGTDDASARRVFESLFFEYGLPDVIRTDNGVPFAARGAGQLTRLSVFWLKLGIGLDRTRPAHPEENGKHERFHRTLKAQTTRPPSYGLEAQDARFDAFRQEYNEERPHEALGQVPPCQCYQRSEREYAGSVPEPEYPGHWEVRSVHSRGEIKWRGGEHFLSRALTGERVGLFEVEDGKWLVAFVSHPVAVYDAREDRLQPLHLQAGRVQTGFIAWGSPDEKAGQSATLCPHPEDTDRHSGRTPAEPHPPAG